MAEIKQLLKEARKLIDENNFKDAQDCCKNILRKDKQNYLALVLLGKSLQDSEQAPLAYQKAISVKPDHPLAWQGLANYYERKEENSLKRKLFSIYDEILKLQIEEEKALEILTKLSQLGSLMKHGESITTYVTYMAKNIDPKLNDVAETGLIELIKADVPCKEEDIPEIINILKKIYNRDLSNCLEVLIVKAILQKSNFTLAVEEVIQLDCFTTNVVLREMLCKYLCQKFSQNNSFGNFKIENIVDKITDGVQNSKYPCLLRSMICYDKGLYLDAYKQCAPLINYLKADIFEATFIIRCTIMLKKWSITQKLAMNFLTQVKDQDFVYELKKILFISLVKQQKWQKAINVAKEIPFENLNNGEQALLAESYIEINESAEHIIQSLQSTEYNIQLHALLLLKQEKYKETVELLQNSDSNTINLYYLGRAYWELKQFDKCQICFLKGAKLSSDHAGTFLYLGHFYHYHKQDLEKAKKCYEKAFNLNGLDNCIVKSLSELYIKMGLKDIDFDLLKSAEKNIQTDKTWISFRLGLHYLNKREWENAILEFRNVIKNDNNNLTAFECLADAYYSRGSFSSALRAYEKVMSIDDSKTSHCLSRIGYIYSVLTQYEDAISAFEKVLQIEPYSLLALKGISETWMRVAKKKVSAKLYGSARDCTQRAITYITQALMKHKQFSCLWKLLGDALSFVTKLPVTYAYVYLRNSYNDTNSVSIRKEKLEIYPQAIACYSCVAKLKQQCSSYDLASAYLDFYCETKNIINCRTSYKLALTCVKEKPYVWRNWNLLGKACLLMRKYDIAQHCFIKALMVTRKWSVAQIWCNLGTLYIKLNLHKLANYCFWRGQSTMPSYPQSWIGQGLIAEVIREEEAMDLFRHACRLGYHPESALGYADWVCRTLKNIEYKDNPEVKYVIDGLYAIPYAIDLLEWYSNFDSKNACACTTLGILQERRGLLRAASQSYAKALEYVEEDKKNITLLNMGRILVRMENYDEAIKIYKNITEASLNSTCGLALALFKKGIYEESYTAYDTALQWLSNDDNEKADLLVAMAGVAYLYEGADVAKTLLFHSIQVSQNKPTAHSLFAICSLGLLHSDQSLSKLALTELQKYEKSSDFGFDIGFLKSYLLICEDNTEQAIKILSESLHDHPSNALLWFFLAQYCLRSIENKARTASSCAQRALCAAHYNEYNCDSAKMLAMASIAEHTAGDCSKAMSLAKKGLHIYPNQAEMWAALLFSLLSNNMWTNRKEWMLAAAGHVRRHLEISRPLSRWVGLLEKKLCK